jgi:conjugative transfer pilus assembly protein TraH
MLLTLPTIARSGWVDDWITSKQSASPSSFQGATRGYYTGGSFQAHWKDSNDYLMTVSTPHIKSGCGGIDTFMGGFAFMDVDYLVQKLQRIMSAAPAAAFDIALKAVSPQISGTLKELGAWADALNNLQLDDCKASKALVATIASPASNLLGEKMQSELSSAQSDFWTSSGMGDLYTKVTGLFKSEQKDVASGTASTAPTIQATAQGSIAGCPQEIVDLYGQGSFLDNIAAKKNLPTAYVELIRGFVGDVEIIPPATTGSTFVARVVDSCDDNASPVAFLMGHTSSKASPTASCQQITDTNRSLVTYSVNMLTSIITKMKTKVAYSLAEQDFLGSMPPGVYNYLRAAASTKMESATVAELANIASNALAYYMLSDLFIKIQQLPDAVAHINSSSVGAKSGADPATCQLSLLNPTKAQFEVVLERIHQKMLEIKENYTAVMAESNTIGDLQRRMQAADETVYAELKGRFTKGIADHLARR